VLVQAGPNRPHTDADRATLSAFLARGGKWLLFLEPWQAGGLESLVKEWGVEIRPVYVADPEGATAGQESTTLFLTRMLPHPITDPLNGSSLTFPYATAVHHVPVEHRELDAMNIVGTSLGAFGIADPRRPPSQIDPKRDIRYSNGLFVATAVAEPVNFNSAEGRREPARLVVVGDTDFVTNSWFDRNSNADFAVNCVDWLGKREGMISLRARPTEQKLITLSVAGKKALWWLILGLLPGFAAALGGFVAWQRRA
jgi:ABC-type uncharacterized transport system involved in gliding motility auxiliary subunit